MGDDRAARQRRREALKEQSQRSDESEKPDAEASKNQNSLKGLKHKHEKVHEERHTYITKYFTVTNDKNTHENNMHDLLLKHAN